MKKLLTLTLILAGLAAAQTPSGLLTGPVSYVSNLTSGNPYGNNTVWTVATSPTMPTAPPNSTNSFTCSASGQGPNGITLPNCYLVNYVVGPQYGNLVASDGTGNCYSWDVWQLNTDGRGSPDVPPCQHSFIGGGMGEYGTLYCGSSVSSDMNGHYNLSCNASWDGTATTVIGGADIPIPTIYTVNVNVVHHTVWVWIAAHFRTQAHWANYQQIDSMSVGVTPQPAS